MNELREFMNSQSYIKFSDVDSLCAKKLAILREKKLNRAKKSEKWANLGRREAQCTYILIAILFMTN